MCGDCWNAAMGAPAMAVAARFAWIGYKDRIPFLGRRPGDDDAPPPEPDVVLPPSELDVVADEREPVAVGSSPPR